MRRTVVIVMLMMMPFMIFGTIPKSIETEPLTMNEYYEATSYWDDLKKDSVLEIYRVNKENNKKTMVIKVHGLSSNKVFLTEDRKQCFFLIDDGDEENLGKDDLWLLDGNTGIGNILFKVTPSFIISNNGRYICYEINKYIKKEPPFEEHRMLFKIRSIPNVEVIDLKTSKIYELDLSDDILKDGWGVGTELTFNERKNAFMISFFIEENVIAEYTFDIESLKFTEIK